MVFLMPSKSWFSNEQLSMSETKKVINNFATKKVKHFVFYFVKE